MSSSAAEGAAPAKLVITLKPEAVSAGEQVLLGEVAQLEGVPLEAAVSLGKLALGRAALPGQSRSFSAADILAAVRKSGFANAAGSAGAPEVRVTAATQTVTGQRMAEAVLAAIRKEWENDPDMEADADATSTPSDVCVRPGELSIQAEIPETGIRPGAQSFRVTVSQAGKRMQESFVSVRVRLTATVQVAASRLQAGEILPASAIKSVRRELSYSDLQNRCDANKLVDLRVKTAISPGQVLARHLFTLPLLIKKGEAVTVYVHRGLLDVTAAAEARNDAAQDEPVRVLLDSGSEVVARASGLREATIDDLRRKVARQ